MRLALALLALWAGGVEAQSLIDAPVTPGAAAEIDPSTLSDQELLDLLEGIESHRMNAVRPVAIFGIPSGFGAAPGIGFVAIAGTNRRDRRREGDWDGSLAFGFGFGDPVRGIGVTPIVDVTSVSPYHFGSSGKIGVTLSRAVSFGPGWSGSVGLSLENLIRWGDSSVLDPEASLAVSAVHGLGNGMPLMLSAGYGTGVSDGGRDDGGFLGVGLGLAPKAAVGLGWYGDEAVGGATFWPGERGNMQISVGIGDMTDRVSGRRLLLAVSLAGPLFRTR